MGKTTGAHRVWTITVKRMGTIGDSEVTTSSIVSSHSGSYNRVSLCISLSPPLPLSLSLYNGYNNNNNHTKVIALSHIYTYMNLGLFTNIASMGLLRNIFTDMSSSSDSHQVFYIRFSRSHPKGPKSQHIGGMTIIDHRIVDSMIIGSWKDLNSFSMIQEPEMTPNSKRLVNLSMKMVNLVAHLYRLAISAGKMVTIQINARRRINAKPRWWIW